MDNSIKDDLIREISEAFSNTKYPGDEKLVLASYGSESKLVQNHFTGHNNWMELTRAFLDFDGALAFFSDDAFRYYIPAFIIADIEDELAYNSPATSLCWPLTPQSENAKIAQVWGGKTLGDRARECFDGFSKDQVRAIISYLYWKLSMQNDDYTTEQAMLNYWLKRLDDES